MRLLKYDDNGNFTFTRNIVIESEIPPYVILSHTWGRDTDEVTYKDILNLDSTVRSKPGFAKLQFCAKQARRDRIQHFWVDTCCIDKSDSSELTEAINSMFRWYARARMCYVYLSDVRISERTYGQEPAALKEQVRASRWFQRGWTLQELLAPSNVFFYDSGGNYLFSKDGVYRGLVSDITGIPAVALQGHKPLSEYGIDEKLRWVDSRETMREEDMAYCMLGIFGVFIPLLYGEGRENARYRLRKAIWERYHRDAVSNFLATTQQVKPGAQVEGRLVANPANDDLAHRYFGAVIPSDDTIRSMLFMLSVVEVGEGTTTTQQQQNRTPQHAGPASLLHLASSLDSRDTLNHDTQQNGTPQPHSASIPHPTASAGSGALSSEAGVVRKPTRRSRSLDTTVRYKVTIPSFRLRLDDLVSILNRTFPEVAKERMVMVDERGYVAWLPRDLTEIERANIDNIRA